MLSEKYNLPCQCKHHNRCSRSQSSGSMRQLTDHVTLVVWNQEEEKSASGYKPKNLCSLTHLLHISKPSKMVPLSLYKNDIIGGQLYEIHVFWSYSHFSPQPSRTMATCVSKQLCVLYNKFSSENKSLSITYCVLISLFCFQIAHHGSNLICCHMSYMFCNTGHFYYQLYKARVYMKMRFNFLKHIHKWRQSK